MKIKLERYELCADKIAMAVGILILLLFTGYWVIGSNALFIIALAIMFGCVLVFGKAELFLISCLLVPNIMIIKNMNFTFAIVGVFLICFAIRLFFFNSTARVPRSVLVCVLLHIFCALISIGITSEYSKMLSLVRVLAFVILCIWYAKDKKIFEDTYKENIIDAYVLGCVMNVVCGVIYYVATGKALISEYSVFGGINNDRNYFSIMIAIGLIVLLIKLYITQKMRWFEWVKVVILITGGLLSMSRTFFILLLFAILVFLMVICNMKFKNAILILIVFVGIVFLLSQYTNIGEQIAKITDRFAEEDVTGGNGRFEVWTQYLTAVSSSIKTFLFGTGGYSVLSSKNLVTIAEHNTIIQCISEYGCLGILTFTSLIISLKKMIAPKKQKLIMYAPVLAILVGYSTVSAFHSDNFNYVFLIVFILMDMRKVNDKG